MTLNICRLYEDLFDFQRLLYNKRRNEEHETIIQGAINDECFFLWTLEGENYFAPVSYLAGKQGMNVKEFSEEIFLLFGQPIYNVPLTQKIIRQCKRLAPNIEINANARRFFSGWIKAKPSMYFMNTTHIYGAKRHAWASFQRNNIAAIGWHQESYEGWSPLEISHHLKTIKYRHIDSKLDAFRSFDLIMKMNIGDLVGVFNVNHGLFGMGIISSSYKFKQAIHDTGAVSTSEWYSHFVDVGWIINKEWSDIPTSLEDDNKMWPVFGTLHERVPVPKYIFTYLENSVHGKECL